VTPLPADPATAEARFSATRSEQELIVEYRPLAYTLAREVWFPGADIEDVRQEALVALLDASRRWRPGAAPFTAFACFVIRRQLRSRLRIATRARARVLSESLRNAWDVEGPDFDELVEQRERLGRVVAALDTLTEHERYSLAHHLNGRQYIGDKSIDNALQRGREKLRAAAA
jgi:RNA polymerase sigma factor (sigma-70 family)